jgi:hypothetical protein
MARDIPGHRAHRWRVRVDHDRAGVGARLRVLEDLRGVDATPRHLTSPPRHLTTPRWPWRLGAGGLRAHHRCPGCPGGLGHPAPQPPPPRRAPALAPPTVPAERAPRSVSTPPPACGRRPPCPPHRPQPRDRAAGRQPPDHHWRRMPTSAPPTNRSSGSWPGSAEPAAWPPSTTSPATCATNSDLSQRSARGRRAWRQAAAAIEDYRRTYQLTDPAQALGPVPREPAQRTAWL